MVKKFKIILLLISLTTCVSLMNGTYSRYVASAKGDIDAQISKWQVLVNDTDITNNTTANVNIKPVIEENEFIANDTFAPSSKGYFDIIINPENVNMSFNYNVNLNIENENMPDVLISKYAIIPESYTEGDDLDLILINNNTITNSLLFNKEIDKFKFEEFTIRVFFKWYEGVDELMDDEDDTALGLLAATEDLTLKMNANIQFEQITS